MLFLAEEERFRFCDNPVSQLSQHQPFWLQNDINRFGDSDVLGILAKIGNARRGAFYQAPDLIAAPDFASWASLCSSY